MHAQCVECCCLRQWGNDIGKQSLSNDKGNPLQHGKLSSPIEIQKFYDYQKDRVSGPSENNNKLLNVSPQAHATSGIPLVIEQMRNVSCNSKDSDSSIESLDKRDSYISSASSSASDNDRPISPKLTCKGAAPAKCEADAKIPPVPLITMLQMQVSEFGDDFDDNVSQMGKSSNASSGICS